VVLRFDEMVHISLKIGFDIGLIIVDPFPLRVCVQLGITAAMDRLPKITLVFLQMLFPLVQVFLRGKHECEHYVFQVPKEISGAEIYS